MINIIVGNDRNAVKKATQASVKSKLGKSQGKFYIYDSENVSFEILKEHAAVSLSLFDEATVVIVKDFISIDDYEKIKQNIGILSDSEALFYFIERELDKKERDFFESSNLKVEDIKGKTMPQEAKLKVFALTDAFEKKDINNTWRLYRYFIEIGEGVPYLNTMLSWKIRDLVKKGGNRSWSTDQLIATSSKIIAIESASRNKGLDMVLETEKLILSL